jgi:hypothetical protein
LSRAAGHLAFPAFHLGLYTKALAFVVARHKALRRSGETVCSAFVTFISTRDTFRFTRSIPVPLLHSRLPKPVRLLLRSSLDSSLGVSKIPLHRTSAARPLLVGAPESCLPSARSRHTSNTFRPRRFSRPRRFAPHRHPAGLSHPAAGPGVRPVSGPVFGSTRKSGRSVSFPTDAIPSGAFPSPVAASRHRDRCPRAVPPTFRESIQHVATPSPFASDRRPTSRPCSTDKSVAAPDVAAEFLPDAPLGFCPTRVHHSWIAALQARPPRRPHTVREVTPSHGCIHPCTSTREPKLALAGPELANRAPKRPGVSPETTLGASLAPKHSGCSRALAAVSRWSAPDSSVPRDLVHQCRPAASNDRPSCSAPRGLRQSRATPSAQRPLLPTKPRSTTPTNWLGIRTSNATALYPRASTALPRVLLLAGDESHTCVRTSRTALRKAWDVTG